MFDGEAFQREIRERGHALVPGVVDADFAARARRELEVAIEAEADYHGGPDHPDYGMVLLCSLYGGCFLELLANERLLEPFEGVLGEGCTIYAYTSSSMPPGGGNYSKRIHVDCPRIIPDYVTNMGVTLLLDDFDEENGATWFLPGSHTRPDPPPADEFFAAARRLIAPAGSAWFFNARLWHAGGINRSRRWRHALTINMCRPWMKQRLDIPRAMSGMDLSALPERALQKLGFRARVPASYDEYYAPPEERTFRQRTE